MSPGIRGAFLLAGSAVLWAIHQSLRLSPSSPDHVSVSAIEYLLGIFGAAMIAYHFLWYHKYPGDDDRKQDRRR